MPRSYDNAKREAQRASTHNTIIETLVDAMVTEEELSIDELAKRAGVARRTVFTHFPNQAARLAGLSEWIDAQIDQPLLLPTSFAELPAYGANSARFILENEKVVRLQLLPGIAKTLRLDRKTPHIEAIVQCLSERSDNVEINRRLATVIVATVRAELVLDLKYVYGLNATDIAEWMQNTVSGLVSQTLKVGTS